MTRPAAAGAIMTSASTIGTAVDTLSWLQRRVLHVSLENSAIPAHLRNFRHQLRLVGFGVVPFHWLTPRAPQNWGGGSSQAGGEPHDGKVMCLDAGGVGRSIKE